MEEENEIECDCYGCVTMRHPCIDEQLREDDALMERLEALGWGPAGNG